MVRIQVHPRLQKTAQRLSAVERDEISAALNKLQEAFGNPHLHSGLSIQRLRGDLFECRAGLRLRILFFVQEGLLTAFDAVDHRAVTNYLKGL